MRLYEISDDLRLAIEAGDREAIDRLSLEFNRKVINCGKACKGLQSEADAIQSEINRLQARKKATITRKKWLTKYTTEAMTARDVSTCRDGVFAVTLRESDKIIITDIDKVPDQFINTTKTASKAKILEAIKADGIIPEGVAIQSSEFIVFS